MYLTPERYRAMATGIDLTDVEDADLRQMIARASALINAYCAVPMQPSGHDFRGGSITAEQHVWQLPDLTMLPTAGSRRVYVYHQPIQTITDFRVKFTNTYEVAIEPSNLYVNHAQGWAEVVALAAIVTGIYPVGINFGLYTPVAEVSYTYGYDFAVTGEELDETDFATFRSTNCFWAQNPAPVVYIGGAEQSAGYSIDYAEGTVTFDAQLPAESIVTVDYHYTMPSAIGEACGLIVSQFLGERDFARRGMTGVSQLRIAEVEIARERNMRRMSAGGTANEELFMSHPEIAALLDPYIFSSVR